MSRNPGIPFNEDLIESVRINKSAIERRCKTLTGRRTVKNEYQVAWYLKAIACIDLTSLAGDDTPGRIKRLCAKAAQPVRPDILAAHCAEDLDITTGAVCVYHQMIDTAVKAIGGKAIPIAAVSTSFPAGMGPMETRLAEIKASVAAGADEIDIVISRRHAITGNWQALYDEVAACRKACGNARMKTILATGELGSLTTVAKASMTAMMAGSDFIKTSTGMESSNATLPVSLVMMRQIRDYYAETGAMVGFKPAGGIRKAKEAIAFLILLKEELGNDWMDPHWFRFGASGLLGDIERQLEFHATGRYSAAHRHAVG